MNERFKSWFEKEGLNLRSGIFLGFITSITIFTIILTIFLVIPFGNQSLLDYAIKTSFESISKNWESDLVVIGLGDLCSLNENDHDRIVCVYNFLWENSKLGYDTKFKQYSNLLIAEPKDFFNESVMCRDSAIMACAIYNQMGYDCELIVVPKHVYSEVSTGNERYKVDLAHSIFEEIDNDR